MHFWGMRRVAVLFALLVAAIVPVLPGPARAADTGSMTGRVVDASDGTPVAGATVVLYLGSGGMWGSIGGASITTAADGTFQATGIPWGTYRVAAQTTDDHVGRFHGGGTSIATALDVVVHETGTTTGVDIDEPAAAHISGTVTAAADGSPVSGATVYAMQDAGGSFSSVRASATGADGQYDVGGLETGQYKIEVVPTGNLLPQSWPDAATPPAGAWVSATLGGTTAGTDLALSVGGHVAGTVRFEGTGQSVTGGRVKVDPAGGGTSAFADIRPDGTFDVPGLRTGDYTVELFNVPQALSTTYDGVHVDAGATTQLDAYVARAGSIAGTVTDTDGAPIQGVHVYAGGSTATTGADGGYVVTGLPPGTYTVDFTSNTYLPAETTGVAVAKSQQVTGVDAVLAKGASIAGTVGTPDAGPLEGGQVTVLRQEPQGWDAVASTSTAADGSYAVTGLAAGTFTLMFTPPAPYATSYLGGGTALSLAQTFDLAAGEATTGLDGAVVAEARISGTVLLDGQALAGKPVHVEAVDPDAYGDVASDVVTSEGGRWSVGRLDPGEYRLDFSCDRPSLFGTAAPQVAGSAYVEVTAGQAVVEDESFPASACTVRTTEAPVLHAVSRVGGVLRIRAGAYLPTVLKEHYSWYVGTHRLVATGSRLRLRAAWRGRRVTAHVVVRRPGYRTRTFTFRTARIR